MNYITIEAKNYEEAVKKARQQYGDRLRIHSRRDVIGKGVFGTSYVKACELTCFLTEDGKEPEPEQKDETVVNEQLLERFEEEAKTPDPSTLENVIEPEKTEEKQDTELENAREEGKRLLDKAERILKLNDFSEKSISAYLSELGVILEQALPHVPSEEEFELALVDRIVGSLKIEHEFQKCMPKVSVFVGGPSSGKTTSILKIAGMYATQPTPELKKTAAVIAINPSEVSFEQLKKVGLSLDMPVSAVNDYTDVSSELTVTEGKNISFVDTTGIPYTGAVENDKMLYVLSQLKATHNIAVFAVIPASSKNSDISAVLSSFKDFKISGIIVTKLDETSTVGNIISICQDRGIPLVFGSDGKKIPRDLNKISASSVLLMLRGFSIDLKKTLNIK